MDKDGINRVKSELALRNRMLLAKPQDLLKCSDEELNTWIMLIKNTRAQNG